MARRRVINRAVLAGVAAFAIALGGATTAVAADDEPITGVGSISGVVTASADGSPLAGIDVHAETDDGFGTADAVTDETGAYVLEDLVDGDYVVRFSSVDGSVLSGYWNDTRDQWRAERITIVDGAAVPGIDAALAAAPTGSISGTVTRDDDGAPVAGVTVSATGQGGGYASTFTDETGAYTLSSLTDDSYVVSFFADGTDLKREYWEDTSDFADATPVVTDGTAVVDIDAALAVGAAIEGLVTRADDASPVVGVYVSALDANNEIVGATETNADGTYSLGGLPAGTYRVRFGSPDSELGSEYWQSAYLWEDARLVTLAEQQTVTGVSADLDVVGYISGTVTRGSDGEPLSAMVLVYGDDTPVLDPWGMTDIQGDYRIAVAPGTYRVRFRAQETGLLEEWWKNARSWDDATVVTVAPGQEIVDIDAEVEVGSKISGTVTLDSDEERTVAVEAWADGELKGTANVHRTKGTYTLYVPEGTYVLKASATFPGSTTTAAPQYYDGVAAEEDATPVVALGRGSLTGVDFTLVPITDTTPEPKPALTLSSASVRAGNDIVVSGTGFEPGQKIAFELRSDPVALGSLTADASGVLSGSFRIPAGTPAGAHTLVALNAESEIVASVALQVAAASGDAVSGGAAGGEDALANTGADLPSFALMTASGLLLAGLLLVRRRRAHS